MIAATGNGFDCVGDYSESASCFLPCNCDVTNWSDWSPCSKSCGAGATKRNRALLSGGLNCNITLEETDICNPQCCPIDGDFGLWSEWSTCTKSCDSGTRKRNRICNNPTPDCGGLPCDGNSEIVESCNAQPCG